MTVEEVLPEFADAFRSRSSTGCSRRPCRPSEPRRQRRRQRADGQREDRAGGTGLCRRSPRTGPRSSRTAARPYEREGVRVGALRGTRLLRLRRHRRTRPESPARRTCRYPRDDAGEDGLGDAKTRVRSLLVHYRCRLLCHRRSPPPRFGHPWRRPRSHRLAPAPYLRPARRRPLGDDAERRGCRRLVDAPDETTFEFGEKYRPVPLNADVKTYSHGENAFADRFRRPNRARDSRRPHIGRRARRSCRLLP